MVAPARASGGPRYLTTRQAAVRLGVTINALKTWIRAAELPALRTPGGHHRILVADLEAFESRLADRSRMPAHSRPRILVVEDDARLLEALEAVLRRDLPDAVVETAADGYEALVQVGLVRPDVLVLDLYMPRLDGFEVCRRLKARAETRAIQILAMTAFTEEESRARILAVGADDFLEKPFDLAVFRDRVVALGGRRGRRR